ncbi:MAG: SulP family inorganic anion transporter [Planctomycetota bacterium]|nr:SulP family inorganic anion transporter [Planctomycetota bacterium]MDG1986112.1 SulP family inorganic anion transporter [Planctomycetota bacterium]
MPDKASFFSNLRGDLFGGLTAGVVALPLALAFGEQSGLGASAGLYGAAFIGFFAAMLGGTATQISGPTAPMTVLSAAIVTTIVTASGGDLSDALPLILFVFMLAGFFQIGLGLMKAGSVIRFIPRTVVSGFMTGIGVIILITQVLPVVGYVAGEDADAVSAQRVHAEEALLHKALEAASQDDILELEDLSNFNLHAQGIEAVDIELEAKTLARNEAKGVIGTLRSLPHAIDGVNFLELALALVTIAIIYGFKRITTVVPSALVALVSVTGAALALGLDYRPITPITSGLPSPHLDVFGSVGEVMPFVFTAFLLSLLGGIDSLLTSVVADNLTKTKHEPNRELIGQGLGNSIAALFGGLPGAGATIRTVVNIQAGGRTRLSGMIAGGLLFLTLLALGPIASTIPTAVLSGVLITVGIGVMDYRGLRELRSMPWPDRIVLLTVLLLTVFWQLVYAVAIGLVLAALLFMRSMSRWSSERFEVVKSEGEVADGMEGDCYVKHVRGPLFFGNVAEFGDLRASIPAEARRVEIDLTDVPFFDQSGVYALEEAVLDLSIDGREVSILGLDSAQRSQLEAVRFIPNIVPAERIA